MNESGEDRFRTVPPDSSPRLPRWIQFSAVILVLLVVFEARRNARFFSATLALQQGRKAVKAGDLRRAQALTADAARQAPDAPIFVGTAGLYDGALKLSEGDYAGAVDRLWRGVAVGSSDRPSRILLGRAQAALALETRDCQTVLNRGTESGSWSAGDVNGLAVLAAAYVCRYALNGDAGDRATAEGRLAEIDRAPAEYAELRQYGRALRRDLSEKRSPNVEDYKSFVSSLAVIERALW